MKSFFAIGKIFFSYSFASKKNIQYFVIGVFIVFIDILIVTLALPYLFQWILNKNDSLISLSFQYLVYIYLSLNLLKTFLDPLINYFFFPIFNETSKEFTKQVVLKIHQIEFHDFQNISTGQFLSLLRRIPGSVKTYLKLFFQELIPAIIKMGIILATLIPFKSVLLFPLIALIIFPFLFYFFSKDYLIARYKAWKMNERSNNTIADSIKNAYIIRKNLEEEERRLEKTLSREAFSWEIFVKKQTQIQLIFNGFITICVLISLAIIFFNFHENSVFLKRQITAFTLPFIRLIIEIRQSFESTLDIQQAFKILKLKDSTSYLNSSEDCLNIDNISFSYGSKHILKNFSLQLSFGDKCALVGPSGVGKSTLMSLIASYNKPTSGHIFYGPSIAEKTLLIPQESSFFQGSLEDNLFYGTSLVKKKELDFLLDFFGIYQDFFASNPLKTQIFEAGKNLSGGQKQKIALIRALLYRPSLLLLDESTCFLNTNLEESIFRFLMTQNFTLIFTTHDKNLLHFANKIYSLEKKDFSYV